MPADIDTAALRELAEKATPVLIHLDLMRYDHGGGRLAILRDGTRKLIADFYGDGADREFYAAANPATILSLLDQLDRQAEERKLVEDRADSWKREAIEIQGYAVKDLKRAEAAEAQVAELLKEVRRWDREYLSDAEVGGIVRHHPLFKDEHTLTQVISTTAATKADVARLEAQVAERDAENARLREAITASQAVLAKYIVPDSGISELAVVNDLLGILDHRDLVDLMRRAALSQPQQSGSETGERGWRPASTAPLSDDGPNYILVWNGLHVGVGFRWTPNYEGDPEFIDEGGEFITPPVTHWMPRPEPPAPAGSEGKGSGHE